jgi:glutamyl-tRNA synthetase
LPSEEFAALALPHLQKAVKNGDYTALAKITQSRVSFIKDCAELVDFIDELPPYDIELYTHKKVITDPIIAKKALEIAIGGFSALSDWNHNALFATVTSLAEENSMKNGQILWPVRTALSGKPTTPCGATEICEILGKTETLHRLAHGLEKLQ